MLTRRQFVEAIGAAGAAAATSRAAGAQTPQPQAPPSTVTIPPREGKLIGRIRLPEVCGNLCFGGPKRNRLFMAASQSLYAVYVNTQGAAPG
jgi:sugar lactone lactonase YvrE